MTAGDSRVEWFLSFESRVVAPLVPARVLGGSQMVIERALELVAELRFAREPEKLKVELDPGGRDARLTNVRTHLVGQDMIVPEKFARAGAAADVQTVRNDVLPGVSHRLQQAAVAGGPGQLAEADQVREHLVRLAIGRLVHALARSQRRRDGRAPWLIPRLHDVPREFEVPPIAREPVEQDDRLENAGCGHADVGSGRENTLLARK